MISRDGNDSAYSRRISTLLIGVNRSITGKCVSNGMISCNHLYFFIYQLRLVSSPKSEIAVFFVVSGTFSLKDSGQQYRPA